MRCRRSRGFTLVEVLVVVAVMGVLMSILVPSLQRAQEDARRTVCLANLKQIGAGLFAYAATNKEAGPAVMLPKPKSAPRQLLSAPTGAVNLGLLWPRVIGDARQFMCPSQREFSYNSDIRRLAHDYVAGSYAYAIHIPAGQSPRLGAIRHLALSSDDFTSGPAHDGVGRNTHRTGYNVLYTDGSVTWYGDPNQLVWKRQIYWADETTGVTYSSFYDQSGGVPYEHSYGSHYDVFKVWRSFCYHRPVSF